MTILKTPSKDFSPGATVCKGFVDIVRNSAVVDAVVVDAVVVDAVLVDSKGFVNTGVTVSVGGLATRENNEWGKH